MSYCRTKVLQYWYRRSQPAAVFVSAEDEMTNWRRESQNEAATAMLESDGCYRIRRGVKSKILQGVDICQRQSFCAAGSYILCFWSDTNPLTPQKQMYKANKYKRGTENRTIRHFLLLIATRRILYRHTSTTPRTQVVAIDNEKNMNLHLINQLINFNLKTFISRNRFNTPSFLSQLRYVGCCHYSFNW